MTQGSKVEWDLFALPISGGGWSVVRFRPVDAVGSTHKHLNPRHNRIAHPAKHC